MKFAKLFEVRGKQLLITCYPGDEDLELTLSIEPPVAGSFVAVYTKKLPAKDDKESQTAVQRYFDDFDNAEAHKYYKLMAEELQELFPASNPGDQNESASAVCREEGM